MLLRHFSKENLCTPLMGTPHVPKCPTPPPPPCTAEQTPCCLPWHLTLQGAWFDQKRGEKNFCSDAIYSPLCFTSVALFNSPIILKKGRGREKSRRGGQGRCIVQSARSCQLKGDQMAIKEIHQADQATLFTIDSKRHQHAHKMGKTEIRGFTLFWNPVVPFANGR